MTVMTMMRGNMHRCCVLVFALAAWPRTASAERIVLESYIGNRPADVDRVAPFIRAIFEQHGFIVDPQTLGLAFREHAFRPGFVAPTFGDTLKRLSVAAENDFAEERYAKVAEDLGNLITAMRQNPLILARDPQYREMALRVMVYYALANGRQAQALAAAGKPGEVAQAQRSRDETMLEVIRSFPSMPITQKNFGQEAERLFLQSRDRLDKAGCGRLEIAVTDPGAVIYLNEIVYGVAQIDVSNLIPGRYRVLIQASVGEARQYEVEVTANQVARLNVDWDVDSLLVLGSWVGFKYPSEKEHTREAELVQKLAQKHTNASLAVTFTITREHGLLVMTSTLYSVQSGQLLYRESVELTGAPSDDQVLNLLVERLANEPAASVRSTDPADPTDHTLPPPEARTNRPPPRPARGPTPTASTPAHAFARATLLEPRGWLTWATAGSAAGVLALGGYSMYLHHTCGTDTDNCKYTYPRARFMGYGTLGAGVALGALAAYWFVEDAKPANASSVTVTSSRSGAMFHWLAMF